MRRTLLPKLIRFACQQLPAWETAPSIKYAPSYTYSYALPRNLSDVSPAFAAQYRAPNGSDTPMPAARIYQLQNVYATWQGVVFKHLRVFRPSLQQPELEEYFQEPGLLRQWLRKSVHVEEPVAIVHSQYAPENYYHWMLETLPRLLLREHYPNIRVLALAPIGGFMRTTLEVFGFTNLLPISKQQVFHLKQVVLPGLLSPAGFVSPHYTPLVREHLLSALGAPSGAPPTRRVYVSRGRARRTIANEPQVEQLLAGYGFETVYYETMTLAQQIQLMQQTAVVVSVHGANLVNTLFMAPWKTVIELVSETLINPCYWRLNCICNHNYHVLDCPPLQPEPVSHHSNADIVVDIERLRATLERALAMAASLSQTKKLDTPL